MASLRAVWSARGLLATGHRANCLLLTTAEDNPALPNASGLASLGLADHAITIWWRLIAPNGIPA